jgi:hypothetical protein
VHTSLIENSRTLLKEVWFDGGEALRYIFLRQNVGTVSIGGLWEYVPSSFRSSKQQKLVRLLIGKPVITYFEYNSELKASFKSISPRAGTITAFAPVSKLPADPS